MEYIPPEWHLNSQCTDLLGSYKFNYHIITAMVLPTPSLLLQTKYRLLVNIQWLKIKTV